MTVVESGQLYIRGDELSNQFAIVANEAGLITVTGRQGTTINGSSEPFQVSGSTNLDGARSRNAAFDGGLRIITYGGDDRIDVQGIEFGDKSRIMTGEGSDFVRFLRSTSQHDFLAVTGDGNDTLNFVQARVHGDFNVTTSDGHDSIRIFNSRTWSDTHVFSGTGDDTVSLGLVRLTGDGHRVITHDGDDRVMLQNNNVNVAGLDVYTGDGRDHVFAEINAWNEVEGEIVVAGQAGFDVLDVDADGDMADAVTESGFVSGSDAEGAFWVYDRADESPESGFNYWASPVEFDETTRISSVDWLGSYFEEATDSDNFVVEIFESEAVESVGKDFWFSQPISESVTRFDIGDDANRIDTGETWSSVILDFDDAGQPFESGEGIPRKIFSYSAEIDFEFLGDKTYWVSIYAVTDADSDNVDHTENVSDDFGIVLDYEGENGELVEYVPPTGTQAEPFQNTNAVLFDDNVVSGLDPTRWYFDATDVNAIFTLNP